MIRVLIVDDEMITRTSLSRFICSELSGYEIAGTFCNGQEALDWLETHQAHIVITDIRMPQMDGLELSRRIFSSYPDMKIIIISGYNEFEYAKQALCYHVANYLLKPIDLEELSASLQTCKNQLEQMYSMRRQIDWSFEEYELFFIDLLTKSFPSQDALKRRFDSMNFPFRLEKSAGVLLRISCPRETDSSFQWEYGLETLPTALFNMVKMIFHTANVYPVTQTRYHYDFILITEEEAYRLNTGVLLEQIYQNLRLSCSIDSVSCFSSLTKLADFDQKNPPVNTPSIQRPDSEVQISDDSIIQKAVTYIETNYSKDLTREDVANSVYLSSAYFSRFFKQKTGMSFLNYLTTVRMKKATELLGTRMKINDIAKAVGYQSRNRFFINFRQYTSYSPTEYRRQILKMRDIQDDAF